MDSTNEPLHVLEVSPIADHGQLSRNGDMYRYGLVRAAAVDAILECNHGPWRVPASRNARASAGLSRKEFASGFHDCLRKHRLTVVQQPHPDVLDLPLAEGQAVASLITVKMPPYGLMLDVDRLRNGGIPLRPFGGTDYGIRRDGRAATQTLLNAIIWTTPFGRSTVSTTLKDLALRSGYSTPRTITRALDNLSNAGVLSYHLDEMGGVQVAFTLGDLMSFVFPNPHRLPRGH